MRGWRAKEFRPLSVLLLDRDSSAQRDCVSLALAADGAVAIGIQTTEEGT